MLLKQMFIIFALILTSRIASAQADAKSSEYLSSGISALGAAGIDDVVLTGTATFFPGSSMGTVPVSLRTTSAGSIEITYQSSPNPQIETRSVGSNGISLGAWKDTNSKLHSTSGHNTMAEPAWFFPSFAIKRALASTSSQLRVAYIGEETFRGSLTQHLRITATSSTTPLLQHLAQTDLYLDASTFLPTAIVYNDHPDTNALIDIPVTILYTDYQSINGTLLPNRVQQLRNNALYVDLRIQDVHTNTHVSITPLQ